VDSAEFQTKNYNSAFVKGQRVGFLVGYIVGIVQNLKHSLGYLEEYKKHRHL